MNEEVKDVQVAAEDIEAPYNIRIKKSALVFMIYSHIAAIYGLYLMCTDSTAANNWFGVLYGILGGFGATAGSHRLWSHRTYKAKFQLRLILMILQCFTFQKCIYAWVRDHRAHHKFTDTNADPHNTKRGLFYAHIGWVLCDKHPQVMRKMRGVDLSDLDRDPIVVFQKKYYTFLMISFCFIIPTFISMHYFGAGLNCAFHINMFRYIITLHSIFLVNSVAHAVGMKPYDKNISPSESIFVAIAALGEGFHNYHHSFPWDYKTGEFGGYALNLTTGFINLCAAIGWAYDLKTASPELIKKRVLRSGDGSHIHSNHKIGEHFDEQMWGDESMSNEDKNLITILHKTK